MNKLQEAEPYRSFRDLPVEPLPGAASRYLESQLDEKLAKNEPAFPMTDRRYTDTMPQRRIKMNIDGIEQRLANLRQRT